MVKRGSQCWLLRQCHPSPAGTNQPCAAAAIALVRLLVVLKGKRTAAVTQVRIHPPVLSLMFLLAAPRPAWSQQRALSHPRHPNSLEADMSLPVLLSAKQEMHHMEVLLQQQAPGWPHLQQH